MNTKYDTKEEKMMEQIKNEIRGVEKAWKEVFSIEEPFSTHFHRWKDEVLYDMYDHNQFVPIDEVSREDFEKAVAYQKENGWKSRGCMLCLCQVWLCCYGLFNCK